MPNPKAFEAIAAFEAFEANVKTPFASAFFINLGLLLALPAHALELRYPNIPGFGDLDEIAAGGLGFAQVAQFLFAATLWLAGLLAFGALLWAGFRLATSAGSPGVKLEAKQRLWGIILGVLLLLVSYIVLRTLNPDLTILRNSSFAICKDKGGPVDCNNPFFPTITQTPPSPASAARSLPVYACLFNVTLKTTDGTPALPSSLDPNDPKMSGCNDKLTTDVSYLGNVASSLGGNWDDKAYVAILVGLGRFTFYADPDYGGAWVEITLKQDGEWVCNVQHDGAATYEDCLGKLLDDSRNKKNYDENVPVMLVAFAKFQKGTLPTDTFGGTIPLVDGGDISSIEIEPRSFAGTCQAPSSSPCSPSALAGVFGEHATEAAQICQKESGGNVASLNDTCKKGGADYSVGLFQINLYRTCRCPGAWTDPSNPNWCKIEIAMDAWTCPAPFNQEVLDACAQSFGLGDGTLNAQKAFGISSGGTNWCPWSTAEPCGLC